jgi:anti-sigma regulatory factor (Ser/Thr protein kinase)
VTETRDDVVLSIPADSSHLRIARLAASSLAADVGLGLDETEDLRVAVTELCSVLLDDDGDGRIELRYRVADGDVVVEGARPGVAGEPPELDPIARELLNVTTDEHSLGSHDGAWRFAVRKGPARPS